MKSVSEQLAACLANVDLQPPLEVSLVDAVGCVVADDVVAGTDMPYTDVAARDGYAVRTADIAAAATHAPVDLPVLTTVLAGATEPGWVGKNAAVAIAAGAPIPAGADAVVPLEATDYGTTTVRITTPVWAGANITRQGHGARAGSVVLPRLQRLGSRQVALLAGVGQAQVTVYPFPRVVIVSIGDELVEPGSHLRPGSVFDANAHALATAAQAAGATVFRVSAVPDQRATLLDTLTNQLVRADVLITTGGLSCGEGDTVKDVLRPLGSVRFDNVAVSPGGQCGVGKLGRIPLFALPGDPVAAYVGFEMFVRPALRKMAGQTELFRRTVEARLAHHWTSPAGRLECVCVTLTGNPTAGYLAEFVGEPGDVRLLDVARANAFAVIPEAVTTVRAGDTLHCLVLEDY